MDIVKPKLNNHIGILICGHGSRNKLSIDEFKKLKEFIQNKFIPFKVEYGFLEFAKPSLVDGLEKLRKSSVQKVIAIPAMLFAAGHVKNDIPSVLLKYAKENAMEIVYGRELGINNLMISAACERVKEVFQKNKNVKPEETVLVVVGRGSSDPDANSNVAKITRMIVEGIGIGWGETVFSGVTFPLVEPGLKHVVKLGYKNIIVFPYFLFSGVLVSRIRRQTELVSTRNRHVSFFNAEYLSSHPYVIETFKERVEEILNNEDNNFMNCSLCKYRSNLFGFEKAVGLIQESHHDHVEGLGTSCSLCESECNGKCEIEILAPNKDSTEIVSADYDDHHSKHHHENYPNSKHPLGPISLRFLEKDKS